MYYVVNDYYTIYWISETSGVNVVAFVCLDPSVVIASNSDVFYAKIFFYIHLEIVNKRHGDVTASRGSTLQTDPTKLEAQVHSWIAPAFVGTIHGSAGRATGPRFETSVSGRATGLSHARPRWRTYRWPAWDTSATCRFESRDGWRSGIRAVSVPVEILAGFRDVAWFEKKCYFTFRCVSIDISKYV